MGENRRVRMTKKMLQEAMLELLEQKPIQRITVTDICQLADVNRSTFYAYYEDVGKLLLEIEDEVLDQLPVSPDIPATTVHQFLSVLEDFFDYVRKNERLFRILILQRDSSSFNHRLVNAVMEKYSQPSQQGRELLDRYAYVYCVNGVIGILREWISGGFPLSTHEFTRMVLQMSIQATAGEIEQ
ncbi:MAG TPA: TetR/AcrR family transcriptional regulator [Candidatus Faecousia intestinigallinarum]|nr:TetR/AcrR family transcriptional regulator [Candidatus Faecousia intestinigallinarum]